LEVTGSPVSKAGVCNGASNIKETAKRGKKRLFLMRELIEQRLGIFFNSPEIRAIETSAENDIFGLVLCNKV
jgi:hypothetical protein